MFKPVEGNADFPAMEKKWSSHWYENGIVENYLRKNSKSKKRFSFLDGPITANNPMGVHHAWGRTYKDIWQRFYNLLGYEQRFQNGFDCQGLWVEVEVEKELGLKSKKDIENLVPGDAKASIAKFVELCKARVRKYSGIQTEQTKRLGNFMDWDNSYFTMSPENNYMIWHFLKTCHENGWIYKGRGSVPWCPRCETAISQHEMLTEDYKEIVHESVYFELPIVGEKNEYLLVWTTTPWTIPANIAVAVDKDFDYALVEGETEDRFWVARELVEPVFKERYKKIVKTVKGSKLVGLRYEGPFDDLERVRKVREEHPEKFHTVIPTDQQILPISTSEGTGLVHTAVSAGVEDFKLGKKLGLPMIPVIADNADYLSGLGFLSGKNAKKNPRLILNYLLKPAHSGKNWVFEIHNYKHRYPACWRCKAELVWKVEDEWYIAMDKPSQVQSSKFKVQSKKQNIKTLRQRMVEVAKKVRWMPEFGLDRELDWLKNMHDWLISKKNRYWGLTLPIYECASCGSFEVIGSKEELRKRAVKGWDQFEGKTPHKPYIDEVVIRCPSCGRNVRRINDVGNPWLDAGIIPFSTLVDPKTGELSYTTDKAYFKKWFPGDFITESFPGQFKNWFYSLIAMATVLEDTPPFRIVLGFGTLLGEDGRPMHKSWGNAIEFGEGADKIGVDVMRWMFCRQNSSENMLFGYKKADEVRRQFYLLLWNIYKFFVEYAYLDKIKDQRSKIKTTIQKSKFKNILDQWIVSKFVQLVKMIEKNMKDYNAKDAVIAAEEFVNDLSTWYIRRSRERVWVHSEDKEDKDAFYTTLHAILVNLSVVLSPFLPFVTEEIYQNLAGGESVHLASWPTFSSFTDDAALREDMSLVRAIVEAGRRARKELGIKVRQPLASARVNTPKGTQFRDKENLAQYERLIATELNVKALELEGNTGAETSVSYDTQLTPALIKEGQVREIIRTIQDQRKEKMVRQEQKIVVSIPKEFAHYFPLIQRKVAAESIVHGDTVSIVKVC